MILPGRWEAAREGGAKAQALDPANKAWSFNLGHAGLLQGKRERTQHWYRRALPLIPDQESLHVGPRADLDLFIGRGWQVEAAREARDRFLRGWGQ